MSLTQNEHLLTSFLSMDCNIFTFDLKNKGLFNSTVPSIQLFYVPLTDRIFIWFLSNKSFSVYSFLFSRSFFRYNNVKKEECQGTNGLHPSICLLTLKSSPYFGFEHFMTEFYALYILLDGTGEGRRKEIMEMMKENGIVSLNLCETVWDSKRPVLAHLRKSECMSGIRQRCDNLEPLLAEIQKFQYNNCSDTCIPMKYGRKNWWDRRVIKLQET